mmetsp:Transcript_34761/g.84270  ORF Transcript_34761/g.84270 Transcript_34761/m.84270 type:complete len:134 (+) Transcript_34761:325-726(+)
MPNFETWEQAFYRPLAKRQLYDLLWMVDDNKPIGHSNLNQIEFSQRANMHLHLWQPDLRQKGLGQSLVKKCVGQYFSKLKLQSLYCEPRKEDPGPNKVLERLGFQLESTKSHRIPNFICYPQNTNLWCLDHAD